MVTFEGAQGVQTYRAIALKSGLALYLKTGMRPNSAWSLQNMLRATAAITGKRYGVGRKANEAAIADLEVWIRDNGTTGGVSSGYVFYVDPGHGWLAVTKSDLATFGLSARDFTSCSYVSEDGQRLYLEEDCDAGKFIEAYKAHFNGVEPAIREKHIDSSDNFIRRLPRNAAGEWKPFSGR